jgi:predicted AAA+ superfamily ATPase
MHSLRYSKPEAKVSYYKDENDIEADLVIEKAGEPLLFVEIKSALQVSESNIKSLKIIRKDFPQARFQLWSQDKVNRVIDGIEVIPWMDGLRSVTS